jgi:predicted dehydrogenase
VTLRVGLVGCGDVSASYVENARAYSSYEIVACAARDRARAAAFGARHGLVATTPEELFASDDVDAVLNLTPVAAHAEVTAAAIAAGKHVYSEKPLARTAEEATALVAAAERKGVRLACAPDVFLGSAYRKARALLDDGTIGDPLAVEAAMLEGGPEERHPNADIFYGPGAGPLLDMGPYYLGAIVALLGPVRNVSAFASTRRSERSIATGPRAGERFAVETPTHVSVLLELESGVTGALTTSYDAPGQYVCNLAVHGTNGSLALPDPNWHGGPLRIRHGLGEWTEVAYESRGAADFRAPGLDDLAQAIADHRPHRASAELALHVLDVATSALRAAAERATVEVARVSGASARLR